MMSFSTVGTTEATHRRGVSAADIAQILGDSRREGRTWRCRCPLHGGRSLALRDGDGGRILVTCWGGCDRLGVLTELRRLKLLDGVAADDRRITTPRENDSARDAERTARALDIWREARPLQKTIIETYLRSRGIAFVASPEALRFHPYCQHPSGVRLPALVARVEHVDRGFVAIHRTFLRADGSSKAIVDPNKASLGPVAGGAVRFGKPREGEWLVIAEGIETTLSVVTVCAMPAWAALSAGGIKKLILPRDVTRVIIAADHDASGTGQRAAREAAQRFLAEGRRVRLAIPPMPNTDWNDVLRGKAPARLTARVSDVD
jgi:putative DNA primase/helicase